MAATTPVEPTLSSSQRWQPIVYLVVTLLIMAVTLPTVLRASREQPTSSAEFSPDAPPDTPEEPLFEALQQAKSGTVGTGKGEGPPGEGDGEGVGAGEGGGEGGGAGGGGGGGGGDGGGGAASGETVPTPEPRSCPFGYGTPPRQIESVYSPPCAPAFRGDNGGSTYKGVTDTEIRIGFLADLVGTVTANGEIKPPVHDDTAVGRTYATWLQYFNQRYQLYGRQLRFFLVESAGGSGDEAGKSKAQNADEKYNVFGAIQETNDGALNELARRKIPFFSLAQVSTETYVRSQPYLHSFTPDAGRLVKMGGEYVCKRLKGRAPFPRPVGDLTTVGQDPSDPREFGIISIDAPNYRSNADDLERRLAQCGVTSKFTARYSAEGSRRAEDVATTMSRMKDAGVTTILYVGDYATNAAFTYSADGIGYYPEWFLPGFGGTDDAGSGRSASPNQWKHAFGFSMYEVPTTRQETECYRAHHELLPNSDPDELMCKYLWGHIVQLLGGIQQAGPELTPETFKRGLETLPAESPKPYWKMTGTYGPNDYTYPDYAAEIYWDADAVSPYDGSKGTYRFVDGARRYTDGEWPETEPVLKNGIAGRSEIP